MAEEHKGIAMVILGVVAIIAIVGLVLLFVRGKSATGEGMYGGEIKQVAYPYWVGRGVPANRPGEEYLWPSTASKDLSTHWNWEGDPKRNPIGDIPSPLTSCGRNGMKVGYSDNLLDFYEQRGYIVVETTDKAGLCVFPPATMAGGIAGYT